MNSSYTKQTQQNPHHHYLHKQKDQDLPRYHLLHFFISFYFLSFQNYLLLNNLIFFLILLEVHFLKSSKLFKNIVHLDSFLDYLQLFCYSHLCCLGFNNLCLTKLSHQLNFYYHSTIFFYHFQNYYSYSPTFYSLFLKLNVYVLFINILL